MLQLVPTPASNGLVVVVDRIEPGVQPPYCTHGRATCRWCGDWCWLGTATYDQVAHQGTAPICHPCAAVHLRASERVGHVADHQRVDGPHA